MVRATILALSRVPPDLSDFGDMAGCSRRQKLWRILIPSARPTLMIGVNQVIMLALNMVIIASMIGAGGLGYDVLLALRALKVGQGMEAGLAIVVLAILLDRLSQAAARQRPAAFAERRSFWKSHIAFVDCPDFAGGNHPPRSLDACLGQGAGRRSKSPPPLHGRRASIG